MAIDIDKAGNRIDSAVGTINKAIDSANVIAKVVNPSSITRLAKDSIFQFPMFISASIDTDDAHILAKNLERNYAALMVSVVSLYGYVNLQKEKSLVKYLRKFHSNGNLGPLMNTNAGTPGTESISTDEVDPEKVTLESAIIDTTSAISDLGLSTLWDNAMESLDTGCLNDIYRPYSHTEAKVRNALAIAAEANGPKKPNPADNFEDKNGRDAYGGPKDKDDKNQQDPNYRTNIPTGARDVGKNIITKDDVNGSMTPTIINLQFVMDATGKGNTWMQTAVIGIKAMTRIVKSSAMITNLVDACKDRAIFKFIDWTKGEKSTLGLIAGLDNYKEGRKSVEKDTHWMSVLKHRGKLAGWQRLIGRTILPNASIILTEQEALEVKNQCGMDIHSADIAAKVIKKYFLLGIGIYDTENKILDIIYDGDGAFSAYSIRALVAENKKETNLLAMNKF